MYPPIVPDHLQEKKVLIYGPKNEALMIKQPRSIGFKPPVVKEIK